MTQTNDDAPQLLGPGGEPMGPSGTGDGAPTEASATQEDTGADAVVPEGPAFHVSAQNLDERPLAFAYRPP